MGMSIREVEETFGTAISGGLAIGMFVGPALSGVLADQWGLSSMFLPP